MRKEIILKRERRKRRAARVREKVAGRTLPRLTVFRSNKLLWVQVIDDIKGKTLVAASSLEVKGKKTKVEQAGAVGELVAGRAVKAGVKRVVFDRGSYKFHGRVKALAEGAREGGLLF